MLQPGCRFRAACRWQWRWRTISQTRIAGGAMPRFILGRTLLAGALFAAAGCSTQSASKQSAQVTDVDTGEENCTQPQGFWRYHADSWRLSSVQLGTAIYTK